MPLTRPFHQINKPSDGGLFIWRRGREATILLSSDFGLQIDFGRDRPCDVLQHLEGDYWKDYKQDGKTVTNPFDFESLKPGRYRLRSGTTT